MHTIPKKKRLILNREESQSWHEGPKWFRDDMRDAARITSNAWDGSCDVIDYGGNIVYSIRDGIPREDFATMCRDQYGKKCVV